jgi:hypothetical protein
MDDTVYIIPNGGPFSGENFQPDATRPRGSVYHEDPECHYLVGKDRVREITPEEAERHDRDPCEACCDREEWLEKVSAYPKKTCPMCGETVKSVARHLPECNGDGG